jgi:hypothetical protein
MSRRPFLVRALLAAMLVSFASSAQELDKKSLERILSKQGFSGQLTGNVKVRFAFLGNMKCGSAVLHVYYYTGEETHPPGKAIHFNRRLIFLENRTYLGQYDISNRPVLVKQRALRFPVSEADGNLLECDRDGLPKSLLLDGGDRDIYR